MGTTAGGLYGLAGRHLPLPAPLTGAAFGLAVWAGNYLGLLPAGNNGYFQPFELSTGAKISGTNEITYETGGSRREQRRRVAEASHQLTLQPETMAFCDNLR